MTGPGRDPGPDAEDRAGTMLPLLYVSCDIPVGMTVAEYRRL